jgi:hypothetical protein
MSELMIMSLGGSPEPLKKSLEAHKPEGIIFLASHDSVALVGEAPMYREPCWRPFDVHNKSFCSGFIASGRIDPPDAGNHVEVRIGGKDFFDAVVMHGGGMNGVTGGYLGILFQ